MRRTISISIVVLLLGAGAMVRRATTAQFRTESGQWVTTWSGAIQPVLEFGGYGGAMPPPEFQDAWLHGTLDNQTIRVMVRSTLSGSWVRIRLTNEYGKLPLTIGAAHIVGFPPPVPPNLRRWRSSPLPPPVERHAWPRGGAGSGPYARGGSWPTVPLPNETKPIPGSDQRILFGGRPSVVIPPGATVASDPVDFETADQGFMAISLYLPDKTERATMIGSASGAIFLGDATSLPEGPLPPRGPARGSYWLSSVEVWASAESKAILIIDDNEDPRRRSSVHGRGLAGFLHGSNPVERWLQTLRRAEVQHQ